MSARHEAKREAAHLREEVRRLTQRLHSKEAQVHALLYQLITIKDALRAEGIEIQIGEVPDATTD